MNKRLFKNKYNHSYQKGMTLVELMVVLSIFVMVTGLTIFDYKNFQSNVSIQNLSSDISLAIRKAQSYAIGSHGNGAGSNFSLAYGVHFDTTTTPASPLYGSNKSFIMFIDSTLNTPPDILYDLPPINSTTCNGVANECSEMLSIVTADSISNIYINGSSTPVAAGKSLDISFKRPNPDAVFCLRNTGQSFCDTVNISNVAIEISNGLTAPNNRIRTVSVWNTGQISIK